MYELVYFLTMVYAAYVIDDVKGEQIILFIKDVFHLDLTDLHASLRSIQNKFKNTIFLKLQPSV